MIIGRRDSIRRPYVAPPSFPIYYCGLFMDDFSETHSTSLYMSTNQIVREPVKEEDKRKAINDWVATGTYSFGCPGSWLKHPAPIHMLAERTNEDPAFPPYRPSTRIGAAPSLTDDASEDHRLAEENFRSQFLTPPPESMDDEQSDEEDGELSKNEDDEPRQLFEEEDDMLRHQSEEEDVELYDQSEKEIDENNRNELWDYIDEAEEIVYDSWITYMYPVMSMQIDNNDPLWVDPEEY